MRFNSLIYPLFLAVVVIVLWALPQRARRNWLLVSSYLFYCSWYYPYLALLVGVAAVNHFGAIWISQRQDRARRGAVILTIDLLVLALFKYLDWGVSVFNQLTMVWGSSNALSLPQLVLPLGISFYVFESISYTMDVIRKREKPHGFWDLQLFIAFFPKLIAGPILRAKELLPQIENLPRVADPQRMIGGLEQITLGLFIKVVLADGVSSSVDAAFARESSGLGALDAWVMGTAFALQIYFDFSGYTRIAIGSAELCGVRLVENFNYPYLAHSPVDFWNRWHMSLSRWIRDYLFFPLLRRETSLAAMCRAAILAMTLCGLWHGAGWTFVLWGFYHGLLIAGYHVWNFGRKPQPDAAKWRLAVGIPLTCGLVFFGWLMFRAQDLSQGLELWRIAVTPWSNTRRAISGTMYMHTALLLAAVWLAPLACGRFEKWFGRQPGSTGEIRWSAAVVRGVGMGLLLAVSLIYLRGQTSFIYFQF